MLDDPVPMDLLHSHDPELVCQHLCCFAIETRKENVELYSPATISQVAIVRLKPYEYLSCSPAFSKILGIMTFMVLIPTCCFVYLSLLGSLGTLIDGCIYKSLASGGNLLMYKSSNCTKQEQHTCTYLLCKSMSLNLCWLFLETSSVYEQNIPAL